MERKQLYTIEFTTAFTSDTVHTIKVFEPSLKYAWCLAVAVGEVPLEMIKAGYDFTHDINIIQEDIATPAELWLHPIRLVTISDSQMLESSLDDRVQGKIISIKSEFLGDALDVDDE